MSSAAARTRFVEEFSAYLASIGFPRMPSSIFTELLASEEESVTARELADRLEVSPASISGGVRYLEQVHLVTRTRRTRERADRFAVADDPWASAMLAEQTAYPRIIAMCERALAQADLAEPAKARLSEARDFMAFMAEELPQMLERWRKSRA